MAKGLISSFACATAILLCSGCLSLTPIEQKQLECIKSAGFSETHQHPKSAWVAGTGNLFVGIGNFYIAAPAGTDQGKMIGVGLLNAALWPLSILWGVPEAAIDAKVVNQRATTEYFTKTEEGRAELKAALDRQSTKKGGGKPAKEQPADWGQL